MGLSGQGRSGRRLGLATIGGGLTVRDARGASSRRWSSLTPRCRPPGPVHAGASASRRAARGRLLGPSVARRVRRPRIGPEPGRTAGQIVPRHVTGAARADQRVGASVDKRGPRPPEAAQPDTRGPGRLSTPTTRDREFRSHPLSYTRPTSSLSVPGL